MVPRLVAHEKKIAKADDRGQQIVEIMRNAAGKLAHRLHFLRLGKLQFEVFLVRGVNRVHDDVGILSRGALDTAGEECGTREYR